MLQASRIRTPGGKRPMKQRAAHAPSQWTLRMILDLPVAA